MSKAKNEGEDLTKNLQSTKKDKIEYMNKINLSLRTLQKAMSSPDSSAAKKSIFNSMNEIHTKIKEPIEWKYDPEGILPNLSEVTKRLKKMINSDKDYGKYEQEYFDRKGVFHHFKKLIYNLNKLYKTQNIKINKKGFTGWLKNDEKKENLKCFIHAAHRIIMNDKDRILFIAHYMKKNECRYLLVEANRCYASKATENLSVLFAENFRLSQGKLLKSLTMAALESITKLSNADNIYINSGWYLSNDNMWIYNSFDEYKSINKAQLKIESDSSLNTEYLLEILATSGGLVPKALISYYILAINNRFLRETNTSPDFAINIQCESNSATNSRLVEYIKAFTFPFEIKPQFKYKGITPKGLIYDASSITEIGEIKKSLPDDKVVTIKMLDNCAIKDYQNKFIDPLYHNIYKKVNKTNPLLAMISNNRNKIGLPYFLTFNIDESDLSFLNKYNGIKFVGLIASVYIKCISKIYDKLNEEIKKHYSITGLNDYKKYCKRLKDKYSEIYNGISKEANMLDEETLNRISWLMLGYILFLEYMEIENTDDMIKKYKEELINKFCNNIVVIEKETLTLQEQVDSFCAKIYDIYQNREINKFLLPYETGDANQKCLGWNGIVNQSTKEEMLIFNSDGFIDRYNSYVNENEHINLDIGILVSELKEIGKPDNSNENEKTKNTGLVFYNSEHTYTALKVCKRGIQIKIDELKKYVDQLVNS